MTDSDAYNLTPKFKCDECYWRGRFLVAQMPEIPERKGWFCPCCGEEIQE